MADAELGFAAHVHTQAYRQDLIELNGVLQDGGVRTDTYVRELTLAA